MMHKATQECQPPQNYSELKTKYQHLQQHYPKLQQLSTRLHKNIQNYDKTNYKTDLHYNDLQQATRKRCKTIHNYKDVPTNIFETAHNYENYLKPATKLLYFSHLQPTPRFSALSERSHNTTQPTHNYQSATTKLQTITT